MLSPHTPWLSVSQSYLTLTLTLTLTRGDLSPPHGSPYPHHMALLTLSLSPPNSYPRPTPPVLSPHTPWLSVSQGYLTLNLTLTLTRGYLSPLHGSLYPNALPTYSYPHPTAPMRSSHPKALTSCLSPPQGSPRSSALPTPRLSSLHGSPHPTAILAPRPRRSRALTPHP